MDSSTLSSSPALFHVAQSASASPPTQDADARPSAPHSGESSPASRNSSEDLVQVSEDELSLRMSATLPSPTDSIGSNEGWDTAFSPLETPSTLSNSPAPIPSPPASSSSSAPHVVLAPVRSAHVLFGDKPEQAAAAAAATPSATTPLRSNVSPGSSGVSNGLALGPVGPSYSEQGSEGTDSSRVGAPEAGRPQGLGAASPPRASSSQMASTTTSSPTRRYDPFAPLPSSANAFPADIFTRPPPPPPSSSTSPKLPSLSSSTLAASPSFLQTSSITRDSRPASLYIPMDDKPARRDASGNTPTWPFTKAGSSIDHMFDSPPASIGTPSSIHPFYAEPPVSPASRLSPRPSVGDDHAYRRSSLLESDTTLRPLLPHSPNPAPAKDGWSSIAVSSSRNGSVSGLTATAKKFEASPQRHSPSVSVGTHALLSSRAPPASKLARQLDTPTAWLLLYFSFNLGLTLFNKLVLQGFPFPWTLTGIQMFSGTIGTQIALNRGFFVQAKLTTREGLTMVAFSTLYTINIAVSNLSLHKVSVPFHQCVRALTPLATIVLSVMFLGKRPSRQTYLSLLPVVFGVVFATFGEYDYTTGGLILTLLGTFLAAFKTIITNRVQVGRLKLHPLDLLIRMSPLAFMQCVLWGWYSGELDRVRVYGATEMTRSKAIALLINGIIAFGLNVVSFTANKKTSALTMTVAANVKQVLTIVLAVLIFHINLNLTNVFGITLTLAGGAWYTKVELTEKSRQAAIANSRLLDGGGEKRAPS